MMKVMSEAHVYSDCIVTLREEEEEEEEESAHCGSQQTEQKSRRFWHRITWSSMRSWH